MFKENEIIRMNGKYYRIKEIIDGPTGSYTTTLNLVELDCTEKKEE